MKVFLKNEAGVVKECKVGISWTIFFFGIIPMLFRKDWKTFAICLVINIGLVFIYEPLTWIMVIALIFLYNNYYIKQLLKRDYVPNTEEDKQKLVSKNLI